ncbi:tyrosine-type recombinase/integrase [Brevundimonas sp.]|uniref:tyrosine-type recombinase/integrase n=1 Tax=Brevundimonas sp. TaxID=1871086 RepID=UPI003F7188A8
MTSTIGPLVYSFFIDHLREQKGLSVSSIRSYRDTLRLFLNHVSVVEKCPVTALTFDHIRPDAVFGFLRALEHERGNSVSTRNQRLAALHTFYGYIAQRVPEMLGACAKVAAIPRKRTPRPETRFLTQDEVQALFNQLSDGHRLSLRDRALMMFLYNTGARVTEAANLKVGHLRLDRPPQVRLLGKGEKWRACPLWDRTADVLRELLDQRKADNADAHVFVGGRNHPMTRFGIYKRVLRLTSSSGTESASSPNRRITPHVFRHTTAVHLLESGVDVNVIRGWLGHVSLETTNRYAEITLRMKADALKLCEPPSLIAPTGRKAKWKDDAALMGWLSAL